MYDFLENLQPSDIEQLEQMVIDDKFKMFATPEKQILSDTLASVRLKKDKSLRVLKLGSNNLGDHSVSILLSFCKDSFPMLEYLDLSFNRLSEKIWSLGLKELAELENIKVINIFGNPASSIDSKPFFEVVPVHILAKLIWIPEQWLSSGGWINCLGNRVYLATDIKLFHESIYARLKKNKLEWTLKSRFEP